MKTLNIICALALFVYAVGCDNGVDPCTPTNNGIEACNDGIDNDCDGQVDEDCGATCVPSNGGIEACNDNIDNDCDGQTDEGCSTTGCVEGSAQGCGGSPAANVCQQRCVGGVWGTCLPIGAAEEICDNGIDDNCNNSIDEYCSEPDCTTEGATEECGGSPGSDLCVRTCRRSQWSECAPNPPNTGTEICDTQDNDCDGAIDEDLADCDCEAGTQVRCGATPEYNSCHQVCEDGSLSACRPDGGENTEEACGDSEDNDCDGQIDEAEPCTRTGCGEGTERCDGTTRGECMNDSWACTPGESVDEACTGEDRGICTPGERSRTCSSTCTWNDWGSCTGVVGPSTESCNGLDDDCDGDVDDNAGGSDSYGSNDSQWSAYDLGTDPEEMYIYPVMDSGGTDWFEFHGDEGMSPSETVTVRLTNLPCDFDITLYWDHPETGVFEELGSSTNGATSDEEYETDSGVTDPLWSDESTDFYIEVEDFGDCGGCYTLYVHGLR